ncbi:MAG: hypothetical protein KY476_08500, partial [Planctomycetes bacterium]|nr:hypothetical protein [Planctomycetota bacterium]
MRGRIQDKDGSFSDYTTAVTVNNVAPEITSFTSSSPECGSGAEGEMVTVDGLFSDIGTLDTHTATIDWGDGTVTPATITEAGGSGSLVASHAYEFGGIYTIRLLLSDDDTGTATALATAVITGAGVHGGTLQIIGTDGDDRVTVEPADADLLVVHASFLPEADGSRTFAAAGVHSIQMLLCDGHDRATIESSIQLPAIVDGGPGDDRLVAGGGGTVLVGGPGEDQLMGGDSRDVLIGGEGADLIQGKDGDDLLIAGVTLFDSDWTALEAILAEWNSDRTFD